MRIDLHTHSDVSDGTTPPAQVVKDAHAAGLDVVALTDHDTLDGLAEAADAAEGAGVLLLAGLEMSTQRWGRAVHLLAYGCDPADSALAGELARVRHGRTDRVPAMVARLTELGLPLSVDEVLAHAAAGASLIRSVGSPSTSTTSTRRSGSCAATSAAACWASSKATCLRAGASPSTS